MRTWLQPSTRSRLMPILALSLFFGGFYGCGRGLKLNQRQTISPDMLYQYYALYRSIDESSGYVSVQANVSFQDPISRAAIQPDSTDRITVNGTTMTRSDSSYIDPSTSKSVSTTNFSAILAAAASNYTFVWTSNGVSYTNIFSIHPDAATVVPPTISKAAGLTLDFSSFVADSTDVNLHLYDSKGANVANANEAFTGSDGSVNLSASQLSGADVGAMSLVINEMYTEALQVPSATSGTAQIVSSLNYTVTIAP